MFVTPLRSLSFIIGLLAASHAWACASCGSGGDDPLILYPWEQWKAYVSFARTGDIESLDQNGAVIPSYGPTTRNTTTVAMGHSFSPRLFATATAPYIVNRREQYDRSAWGDPLMAMRYTVVQQTMASEWIPQVQLMAGYRGAQATSKYDQTDPAQLDVFGSGIPEARAGVDVWSGMSAWKAGFAQSMTVPVSARETDFGRVQAGNTYRSTITFGHGWGDNAKLIGGINREQTTQVRIDGQPVEGSELLSYGTFVSADGRVERDSTIRFTWSRAASLFANRNGTRSQTFSMALMRSF